MNHAATTYQLMEKATKISIRVEGEGPKINASELKALSEDIVGITSQLETLTEAQQQAIASKLAPSVVLLSARADKIKVQQGRLIHVRFAAFAFSATAVTALLVLTKVIPI